MVPTPDMYLTALRARFLNLQSPQRSFQVGYVHYDVGNDLYSSMLGSRMIYSCGYWKDAENLDAAQEHKLDLVCRKLHLKAGQRLLDIGCGWGGTARFAAGTIRSGRLSWAKREPWNITGPER